MGGSIVNKKDGKEDEIDEGIGQGQLYSPKYSQHHPVTNPKDPKSSPDKMEDDAEKQTREKKKGGQDCDDGNNINSNNGKQERERKKMSDEMPKSALFTSKL